MSDSAIPRTIARQAPPSMEFSRQEYWLQRHDEDLREPLVRRQGSQVSMRVARGSASWLSSHGRGLGPRDALKKVASVMYGSVRPHRQQPIRLRGPWDSPGKNTAPAQGNQSLSRELRASALCPGLEAQFPARRREERYDGDLSLPLGLALGSPIFPSGCEGKLGVALELLQGRRDLT